MDGIRCRVNPHRQWMGCPGRACHKVLDECRGVGTVVAFDGIDPMVENRTHEILGIHATIPWMSEGGHSIVCAHHVDCVLEGGQRGSHTDRTTIVQPIIEGRLDRWNVPSVHHRSCKVGAAELTTLCDRLHFLEGHRVPSLIQTIDHGLHSGSAIHGMIVQP